MPRGFVPPELRCHAKSKQTGEQCKQRVMPAMRVCYYHGGKARVGIANPNFKHGKTSRYMPMHLLERYEASLGDEKALEQKEELAIIESKIADLLETIKENDNADFTSVEFFRRMRSLMKRYKAAFRKKDTANMMSALADLWPLIEEGAAEAEAWEDIGKWIIKATKIRESERKRKIEEQQMLSLEEVNTLVAAIADAVKTHVKDKVVLGALGGELTRLVHVRTGGPGTDPKRN